MSTAQSRVTRLITILSITALGAAAGALLMPGVAQAAVPTVTALSIKKGSTLGGTTTLITGKGLLAATAVEFGAGTAASSFIILSDTSIAATAPPNAAGVTEVIVTTTVGVTNLTTVTTNDFTYLAPITPVVSNGPVTLSAAGGTVLTVAITPSLTVTQAADITAKKITATVDGVAASKVAYSAPDVLLVTAPAGSPTAVGSFASVSILRDGVVGPADTTGSSYAAVITKLSITTGPTTGVTGATSPTTKPAITITGAGLTGATAWVFGGTNTATCIAASVAKVDTSWTCQNVPAGTEGPVTVSYTPAAGTLGVTSGATFTYSDLG